MESENETEVASSIIDQSDETIYKALKTHFVEQESYIEKLVDFIKLEMDSPETKSSLVVGCSVGRLPLDLSKKLQTSYGIDYSARYFQMATRLLEQKQLKYKDLEVHLKNFNLGSEDYKKVQLYQMNPENPDARKISNIDVLIVDGNSLRENTLEKTVSKCWNLCSKEQLPMIFVVSNSLRNPGEGTIDLLRSSGMRLIESKTFKMVKESEEIKFLLFT